MLSQKSRIFQKQIQTRTLWGRFNHILELNLCAWVALNKLDFISQSKPSRRTENSPILHKQAGGTVKSAGRSDFFLLFFPLSLHGRQSANTASPKAATVGPGWYHSGKNIKTCQCSQWEQAQNRRIQCSHTKHTFPAEKTLTFLLSDGVPGEIVEILGRAEEIVRSCST